MRVSAASTVVALFLHGGSSPAASYESATQPPRPAMSERYDAADRYLGAALDALIVDGDLRAGFTLDTSAVVYRRGKQGQRAIFVLELKSGARHEIATETALAESLSKAVGREVVPSQLVLERPQFDGARGELQFSAFQQRWSLRNGEVTQVVDEQSARDEEGISPDRRIKVLSRDYNLIAIDESSGREVPLTTDGTRDQPYGRGIPLLAHILEQGTEEPKMPVSVRWSPDSRYILTWQLDTRGIERMSITQHNPPGRFYPRTFQYIYPLAGAAKLPQARRLIVDVQEALRTGIAKITAVDVPSESLLYPADPDMGWSSGKARMLWTERGYAQQVVYEADPSTGATAITAREAMRPLVTVTSSSLRPAPELGGELSISERSGWAQLYLVRPSAPDAGQALTLGEWEVIDVEHVDASARSLLITGVGREKDRNPYWRSLYRVSSSAGLKLLTPEPLDHDVTVSADGRWAIDAMSSPAQPTRTVVRDTRDGNIVAELAVADASALLASGYVMPELFKGVAADGKTELYGMIYRPANFTPSARYPIIDSVYTGPTTTNVPVSWRDTVRADPSSVAQLGAVVVRIDGRGTSRRGQAFRRHAYQNLGEVGLDDHIAMIRQMAQRYPYMDVERVGVYGGSAGGYDAARFVLRRPQFFKVAVSSSGNHDLRLDKAWWPEVSMGLADEATWERNSNMSVAANLTGKLLLIHGDIDDNVPVTESLRLAQALINSNRDVDLVILPNTTHRVAQPFFWRKFRDYFTVHLLGEQPPAVSTAASALTSATSTR